MKVDILLKKLLKANPKADVIIRGTVDEGYLDEPVESIDDRGDTVILDI